MMTRTERIKNYTEAGLWGDETLHSLLRRNAQASPQSEAVVDQPDKEALMGVPARRLTWQQLDAASSACARALAQRGVSAGDAVVLQLPNTSELIVLYYALSKLGAVISPIAVQYGAHELSHFAKELCPVMLNTLSELRGADLAEQARSVLPGVPVVDVLSDLNVYAGMDETSDDEDVWADDANAVLTIAWTSGTTGTPKGVPRTQNMWVAQGRLCAHAAQLEADEKLLSPFPMINMAALGGFLFPSALGRCTLVLHHPLDIPMYLRQLQEEGIHFTLAPPPLLNRLAQQPDMWKQFDFSKLRRIGSGSVPLSPSMISVFENDFGKPIINFYGSNEGIGLISTPENSPSPEHRASLFPRMGAPGMDFDAYAPDSMITKIVNVDTGEEVTEVGVAGELCVDGPGVFDGYLNHDGDGVFTDDGFFRSGDLVEICAEKTTHYRIVGRCKDIINRGGTKLSPSEIDSLLEGAPGVAEASVCAYADDDLGERVCACIVPVEGASPELEDLRSFLTEKGLARFKLPERLEVFEALPRNPLGKVVRGELRAQVEAR
ncbi:MAG: class I adenylate-forming enzyme family protein [Congregibacter sp.]